MKPSITKLLELLDKPALLKWANKIGLEGIRLDDYRSKAKESGLSLHEEIENWLKYKIPSADAEVQARIEKFFSDKEILAIEKNIETVFFTGRLDIKFKWKGFVFIADFKSSGKVYLETKIQLAGYKMAEECDHVAVIHLPELLIRPIDLMPEHGDMLIALSSVYNIKQKLEAK